MYQSSLQDQCDYEDVLALATKRAKEEGFKTGQEAGRINGHMKGEHTKAMEIAVKLKQQGFPVPDIASLTGLNPEIIKQLR